MRRATPIIVVVALLLGGLYFLRDAPAGAPPVTTLTPDLAELREAFNDDSGRIHVEKLLRDRYRLSD